jgi:lipid-A-disaccharide synthase
MTSGRRTVLLVAGEASGDMHGAALLEALRRDDPDVEVWGVGGERLRQAGMHILVDTAAVATMGFVETFGTLGRLLSAYRRLMRFLVEKRPQLVILIDFPEFNLFFAKRVKALGIRVFYYIGPQVWAWRPRRVRKIVQRVDRLGLVFPFEPPLYNNGRRRGLRPKQPAALAEFVGHPLLDIVQPTRTREETLAYYHLDPGRPLLLLLPGSRKKELRYLLQPALQAAELLARSGWQVVIGLAHTLSRDDVAAVLRAHTPAPQIVEHDTYNLIHAADTVLVASGTATLETALLGRPMVIMYRVAPLTFALARRLVHVDYIGMPNIILGRRVFPELIQAEVTPERLAAVVQDVSARRDELTEALRELRGRLGGPGAAARAARIALELMA